MSLQKRAYVDSHFDSVEVNVYDIKTHEIVFSGNQGDVANLLGVTPQSLRFYLRTKCRFKKKYAIRIKGIKQPSPH